MKFPYTVDYSLYLVKKATKINPENIIYNLSKCRHTSIYYETLLPGNNSN